MKNLHERKADPFVRILRGSQVICNNMTNMIKLNNILLDVFDLNIFMED